MVYILSFIYLIDAFPHRVAFCNCTSKGLRAAPFITRNCTSIIITGTWLSASEISCIDVGIVVIENWNEIRVNGCHTIGWCGGNDRNGCNKFETALEMHFFFLRQIDDNCSMILFYLYFCSPISPNLLSGVSQVSYLTQQRKDVSWYHYLFVCIRNYRLNEIVSLEF